MPKSNSAPARVCFCGRPNVGKSSLFNRLVGRRKALVLDEPGVTRDVYRARVSWDDREIELADLAGLELWGERAAARTKDRQEEARERRSLAEKAELRRLSMESALRYLESADLVLFVIDGRAGLTPADEELARVVRQKGRRVIPVLAKIEGSIGAQARSEAAALGWDDPVETSAEHNLGIGELRERIIAVLGSGTPAAEGEGDEGTASCGVSVSSGQASLFGRPVGSADAPIRLGVYGRPNVGKSTLVNWLVGEDRMITSPIAGTTVDTIDTDFSHEGKYYRIVDTAGIRRKARTARGVEVLSVVQALKSVGEVDAALFLLDGYEGVTDQDEKIAGELFKAGKPIAVIVNKWDLCRVDREEYAERLRKTLAFLDFAPVLFVSAEKRTGMESFWDLLGEMLRQRQIVASTGELNRFLELVEGTNNPTGVKLFYASQTSRNPPTVTLLVSDPKKVHFAYEGFLRNELRQRYGWMGSPLRLIFKERKRR